MKRTKAAVYRQNHIPAIFLSQPDLQEDWKERLLDNLEDIVEDREYRFRQLKETISAGQTIRHIVTQEIRFSKSDGTIHHSNRPSDIQGDLSLTVFVFSKSVSAVSECK